MRPNGWRNSGYYPTPHDTLRNISSTIMPYCRFPSGADEPSTPQLHVLDPCCGEGTAVARFAQDLENKLSQYCRRHPAHEVVTWGIEVNEHRAREARKQLNHVINEDFDNILLPNQAFHVVWLNPPYDWDREETTSTRRLESHFLQTCTAALRLDGRLYYIVPQHIAAEDAAYLARNYQFENRMFRLPDPDYEAYNQVAIWGDRAPTTSNYVSYQQSVEQLTELARAGADAEPLTGDRVYEQKSQFNLYSIANLQTTPQIEVLRHSRDELLSAAQNAGLWQHPDLRQLLDPDITPVKMRPLEPLRGGHISLIIADGQLDNIPIADPNGDAFCIKGQVVKKDHTTTDDENKIVIEERFHSNIRTMNLTTGAITDIGENDNADNSLSSFVGRNFESLAAHTTAQFPPKIDPTAPAAERVRRRLTALQRAPIGKQGPSMISAAINMRQEPFTLLVGQQGSGKTNVAIGAVTGAGFSKMLVQAPTHAIETWIDEIRQTTPHALIFTPDAIRAAPRPGARPHLMSLETLNAGDHRSYESPNHRRKRSRDGLSIDLETLSRMSASPEQPIWVLLPKDKAKLGYAMHPLVRRSSLVRWNGRLQVLWSQAEYDDDDNLVAPPHELQADTCVHCWSPLGVDKKEGTIIPNAGQTSNRKLTCPSCDEPVFGPNPAGQNGRRIAIAEYIASKMARWFDVYVIDELHQYKADNSGQGVITGRLGQRSRRVLGLTGTITGGKAEELFYILQRFKPGFQQDFGWRDVLRFTRRYGRVETTIYKDQGEDVVEVGAYTKRRQSYNRIKTLPGIHPHLLNYIMDCTSFVRLNDINRKLPPAQIIPRILELDDSTNPWPGHDQQVFNQQTGYKHLETTMRGLIKNSRGKIDPSMLSTMLQLLLTWPENGWNADCLLDRDTGLPIVAMPTLDPDVNYPKERELVEIIKGEIVEGRKALVYCTHTNRRDVTGRVQAILTDAGIRTAVMTQAVAPRERLNWMKRTAEVNDVVICNPQLVETGLNLLQFPTIIWYETHFSTYVTQQASARSHRLNQTQQVRIYHLAYANTFQERALRLVATKADASDIIYGELAGGNLSALNVDSSNIISTLAKDIFNQIQETDSRSIDERTAEILRSIQLSRDSQINNSVILVDDAEGYEAGSYQIEDYAADPDQKPVANPVARPATRPERGMPQPAPLFHRHDWNDQDARQLTLFGS